VKLRIVYAVHAPDASEHRWLADTCGGGGSWAHCAWRAVTFASREAALEALAAAEIADDYAGGMLAIVELVQEVDA